MLTYGVNTIIAVCQFSVSGSSSEDVGAGSIVQFVLKLGWSWKEHTASKMVYSHG